MTDNNNTSKRERVNQIKTAIESLTVEELCNTLKISGLKRTGDRYRGNCPIHGGDSKSFTIYRDKGRIVWNCPTSCGSGNVFYLGAKLWGFGESLKGKNWISLINKFAQAMGLPSVDGGELTVSQLDEIRRRGELLKAEREKAAEQEAELAEWTDEVLTEWMRQLGFDQREIDYLKERGVITAQGEGAEELYHAGCRSFSVRSLTMLCDAVGVDKVRAVLGDGTKLVEQFKRRPLLVFTTNSDCQTTGVQARSVDPKTPKEYRFISRGKISSGFFNGHELCMYQDRKIVCVEGMTDLLAAVVYREKLEATLGRELVVIGKAGAGKMGETTAEQFTDREVLFLFDDDEAGVRGAGECAAAADRFASSSTFSNIQGGDLVEVLSA